MYRVNVQLSLDIVKDIFLLSSCTILSASTFKRYANVLLVGLKGTVNVAKFDIIRFASS